MYLMIMIKWNKKKIILKIRFSIYVLSELFLYYNLKMLSFQLYQFKN